MIKIEKDYMYLTFGEGCYVMRARDGALYELCFGRRVEPEDDLPALGIDGVKEFGINSGLSGKRPTNADFAPDTAIDADTGDRLKAVLRFAGAEVTEKPDISPYPSLRGDKTLRVRLIDSALGLSAELYYTPYARGGISRCVKLCNTGMRTLRLRAPSFLCSVGDDAVMQGTTERHLNYAATAGSRGAYGFCTIYGGAALNTLADGIFDAELDEDIVLAPQAKRWLPETLAVYSPDGADALARALDDILRENLLPQRFLSLRRPIAFFGSGTAQAVGRLGADAFVTDVRLGDDVTDLAEDCKAAGLMSGVRLGSAAIGERELNFAVAADRDEFVAAAERFISVGVEYIDLSEIAEKQFAHDRVLGLYDILSRLAAHEDVVLAVAADFGALKYAPIAVCKKDASALPPCAVKKTVTRKGGASLKSEFDCASIGSLCYEFDLAAFSEELCRAVRAQIFCYQDDAAIVVSGDVYRSADGATVTAISKDKSKAYAVCVAGRDVRRAFVSGVDVHALYLVRELDRVFSGAAIVGFGLPLPKLKKGETVSFHLRQVTDYE